MKNSSFDFPYSVRLKKIKRETPLVRSYSFDFPLRARPGQFVFVWLPGVEEKPMSIAFDDGKSYTLAIAAVGPMTRELAKIKVGDYLGIRGPYGTHFEWKPGDRIAMLAGGYGAGPLLFASNLASKQKCKVDFFMGACDKNHLLFGDKIKKLKNVRYLPSTNDGSAGFKGFNVQLWEREMARGAKYDRVFTCGPELMMKAVSDIAWKKKIDAQITVERYMKCGFGVCGNCCLDDSGIAACQKGTVMSNVEVRKVKEFGVYHRDNLGKKHYYKA